jgi:3'-5' exoribonuclease
MVWADGGWFEPCERDWVLGRCYKIRGQYAEHERYGHQIEVQNIREVIERDKEDGFDLRQLIDHSRFEPDGMFRELSALVEANIVHSALKRLVLSLLERHAGQLKRWPATRRHFYPFAGGLLEHTLAVTKTCLILAEKYAADYPDLHPPLNRDLIVAAAALHDLGRLGELEAAGPVFQPTVNGQLLGHLLLGRDMVRAGAAENGDLAPELLALLEHLLVGHLAIPEWGSLRLPLIPECLILHHADDLDAKMEMYVRCLTRDQEPGQFTARDPILGRSLLKGRDV